MIVGISFSKGGTGKTTTCLALHQALRHRGYTVLSVDMDPQCSLTDMMGGCPDKSSTVYDVLAGRKRASDAIVRGSMGEYIPASPMLSSIGTAVPAEGRDARLRDALAQISGCYSFILIDSPPALGLPQTMALMASDLTLIPLMADRASHSQLMPYIITIGRIQDTGNPNIDAAAIITRWFVRIRVNAAYDDVILSTLAEYEIPLLGHVRESSAIREAQAIGSDLYAGDYKRSHPAEDYLMIADKLIEYIKQKGERQ